MDLAAPDDRRLLREFPTIHVRDGDPVAYAAACSGQARAVRDVCPG